MFDTPVINCIGIYSNKKIKKTNRPRTSFATNCSLRGSKVLHVCRTATSLTGTLSPISQPNWKESEDKLFSYQVTTNLVLEPKLLDNVNHVISNHYPGVPSNSLMELQEVALQGPAIRIFGWRVNVLDTVGCEGSLSF